jgi:HK97 family phage prohead protease
MAGSAERRFTSVPVESRASGKKIGGYAAKFMKTSRNLGGFIEVIDPRFFNKSRGDGWPDVMARYNHDDNMLLGTTGGGTLSLRIDDIGLDYEVTLPSTRGDIAELVARGDVRKSSFAFRTFEDDWSLSDQGFPMRTLLDGQLVDVAPVNTPAYNDTSTGVRSLDVSVALRSFAEKFEADVTDVASLAAQDELRKFLVRTDNAGKPASKPKLFAPAAAAQLMARRSDPWVGK